MQPTEIVRAFYDSLNAGALPANVPADMSPGLTELLRAFPDVHYTLTHLFANGDQVAARWTLTGTHSAPFRGHAPTHKQVSNTGMAIFTIANGAIAGAVMETDRLHFLQQIGALP